MPSDRFVLRSVGHVESELISRATAPLQAAEGAPEAWLVFDGDVTPAITDLEPGGEILVLTWLHLANRDVLRVHPRGNPHNAEEGVFSTRSPDRPNPIGVHRTEVLEVGPDRLRVSALEAVDGTPIIDVKPILHPHER